MGFAPLSHAQSMGPQRGPGGPGQMEGHGPDNGPGHMSDRHAPAHDMHGRQMAERPDGHGRDNWHDNNPDMNRTWHAGERYDGPRNSRWVVNDWQRYHGLSAPPAGYQWMRYGNQYLLTALTTGVIAGVVSATVASQIR
ncbi:hypothetical protein CFR78_04880 [Komagataeibacter rhaeticus]|nr:hypothetical protein CFR78_04880 [Komagataeibacter rhaeticus]